MSKAKLFMRQAHSQQQVMVQPPLYPAESKKITPGTQASNGIKEIPKTPRPATPPSQHVKQSIKVPTGVSQIAREDAPLSDYGVKPVATNFNCYNKEVFKWLRDFSSNNQFNGGVPITKSQVIEIALDVLLYDLGINPIGYESQQTLREDIQNKIRGVSQ